MRDMFRSATLKLTVWYLVLVMAISLVFSAVIYRVATAEVARGLNSQTQRIYRQFPVFNGDPFFVRDQDLEASERHILLNLVYVNLAVLVGAGLASYWLAKRTLVPIEAANEQQKQFVADASHELRTPVTTLKMETEVALMDKDASAAELKGALRCNLEEAGRLEMLLNNLLRLSRLESDELVDTFAPVAIDSVISAAIERTASLAGAKAISIASDVPKNVSVSGDRESLVELFTIVVDNAIKYSPAGAHIEITAAASTTDATVTVRDHGIGIEPAALEHVFDRFYRADRARTSNNGYGLGLAIAKRIADLHHSTITLKSTVGKGTRVIIGLPLAPTV